MAKTLTDLLHNIHFNMLKYQRINNIENQCITNTEYLYYTLKQYSAEYCVITRVRPVIVLLENNTETKTLRIHSGHLVVQLGDNKIYECCYDI